MPTVSFAPSGKTIEVKEGTTLFDAAQGAGLPVASSCSAEYVCGKCNMRALRGEENLSQSTELEKKLLRREKKPQTDRISCQTHVLGDCTVTTGYW